MKLCLDQSWRLVQSNQSKEHTCNFYTVVN